MAIVNLGTQVLDIGGGAKSFTPINFKDDRAYLIKGVFTISNPNNIFSLVRVRAFLTLPGQPPFWAASFVELEILPEPFSFFYPFSPLYDGDGTAIFFAERIPKTSGAGELGTVVTLNLFYDDETDIGTWLRS
jgi:hypothetical protein